MLGVPCAGAPEAPQIARAVERQDRGGCAAYWKGVEVRAGFASHRWIVLLLTGKARQAKGRAGFVGSDAARRRSFDQNGMSSSPAPPASATAAGSVGTSGIAIMAVAMALSAAGLVNVRFAVTS